MPAFVRGIIALCVVVGIAGYWWLVIDIVGKTAAHVSESEQRTIQSIEQIRTAQQCYVAGSGGWARSLQALQGFVQPELIPGRLNGYVFLLVGTKEGYELQAYPEEFGKTGYRSFWMNQDGRIRESQTEQRATSTSPFLRVVR